MPRSAIAGPPHCRRAHAGTQPGSCRAGRGRFGSRPDGRTGHAVCGGRGCAPRRYPPSVAWRRQDATVGANLWVVEDHRRARSAGEVLPWHAVHHDGAHRAPGGCAHHRSGRQLLPSTTATTGDDAAPGAGRHALAEAVLAGPAAAVRLVRTLHDLSLGALRHGVQTPTSRLRPREASRRRFGRRTTSPSAACGRRPHRTLRPDRIVRTFGRRPCTVTVARSYRAGRPLNARGAMHRRQRRCAGAAVPDGPHGSHRRRDCPHVIPKSTEIASRAWGKPARIGR